jgi:hypothetical protein
MNLSVAVGMAAMAAVAIPAAAADGLTLSAGFDYSSGKYGAAASTEVLYLPLMAKYESGPLILKLTVPRVEINRPASSGSTSVVTVTEEDFPIVTTAATAGQSSRVSGLGDVGGAVTYNLFFDGASGLLVDVTAKAKFATGDQNLGLSTGKNDYALQLDFYKTIGQTSLLGTVGYKWMGKPDGLDFRNVPYASAGIAYKLGVATTVGIIADYRQSVVPTSPSIRELTLYLAHHLDKNWKLQGYLVGGMSDASPDAGVGATIGYAF